MRSMVSLDVLIAQDDEQLQKLLSLNGVGFDDNDPLRVSTYQASSITLVAGATDVAVPFSAVTSASLMILVADQDISVKLNGSAVGLKVLHTAAAISGVVLSAYQKLDQPGLVVWRGQITSISLTNLSATATAKVRVFLVGEQS